jgi:hypothetical protein
MENLRRIKNLSWKDVFAIWRKNEAHQEGWNKLARERGYASWEEWRLSYTKRFGCPELKWSLYDIIDPVDTVSEFWGGPFSGWVDRYYEGEVTKRFDEMALNVALEENPKVKDMLVNFPSDTILTGIKVDNRIYIIEGMHRASALAMMKLNKTEFIGKVRIALAESKEELKYEPSVNKADLKD